MRNYILIGLIGLASLVVIYFGLKLVVNSDKWVCRDSVWVKQGNPKSPMPTTPCGSGLIDKTNTNTVSPGTAKITVTSPTTNQTVSSPITLTGTAEVANTQITWRLKSSDGAIIIEGNGTVDPVDKGLPGSFRVVASYPETKAKSGSLEVYGQDADGNEFGKVIVLLKFAN